MRLLLTYLATGIFIFFSCTTPETTSAVPANPDKIRLNQLGYYPGSAKVFAVVDSDVSHFSIIDNSGAEVFSGSLEPSGTWEESGESVRVGDFSAFTEEGSFMIVAGENTSYPFEIRSGLYEDALKASIKSYYFQRASTDIPAVYGEAYARAGGHPDSSCIYHESSGREGIRASAGGWYDAGDYGKYIVNAALSVGQMLNLLEMRQAVAGDALGIPESGNGVDDLADELKYELDWMLTMQDDDGGVFHKLTALNFSGFIMPEDYTMERFIIGKGTAATLDFAAVMAQASRVYGEIDSVWSDRALAAAERAYEWALENPDIAFKNPEDVATGEYGDNSFDDDFYWAATELAVTTGKYYPEVEEFAQPVTHEIANSWRTFVRNVAFQSVLINRDSSSLQQAYIDLADSIDGVLQQHPYRIALNRYEWGSNSDILNQAVILCMAHEISGEQRFLDGAIMITDYLFGKNATGYSFLTGFGDRQVMNVHHRPSAADGIEAPVPGFVSGGPNVYQQDRAQVTYASKLPAKSFEDVTESYASNEVCLNWNAPAVFVLGYIESVMD